MTRCRLASAPLVAGLLIASCALARAGEPHAFIELFTSQGCSSCPAADKLLGELAADNSVVAVSVPIDYWDYLGWKDTLASPAHSARQRAYAHVRGDREVYTPQIVVNGAVHVLGSDRDAIEHAITQTERNGAIMSVPVLLSVAEHNLTVRVGPAGDERAAAEVWLCPLETAVPVVIGRGENGGQTVTYHNVVRRWLKLSDWPSAASTWNIPLSQIATGGVDAVAVLVQEGTREKPGLILGAGIAAIGAQAARGVAPAASQ